MLLHSEFLAQLGYTLEIPQDIMHDHVYLIVDPLDSRRTTVKMQCPSSLPDSDLVNAKFGNVDVKILQKHEERVRNWIPSGKLT